VGSSGEVSFLRSLMNSGHLGPMLLNIEVNS